MLTAPREGGFPVSVIMPAYNAAATISESLECLLSQTSPDWEAIVVDDGSTDRTKAIADSFAARDGRIRVITRCNGGEGAARNHGIANARYPWLLFLDADDWIAPSHLEILTAELRANPALDAVHCGWARVARDGTRHRRAVPAAGGRPLPGSRPSLRVSYPRVRGSKGGRRCCRTLRHVSL